MPKACACTGRVVSERRPDKTVTVLVERRREASRLQEVHQAVFEVSWPMTRTMRPRPGDGLDRGVPADVQAQALEGDRRRPTGRVGRRDEADDSDADQPGGRRQLRRPQGAVHQGAGRLEAQDRFDRRRHRGVGQGGDSARPREEGRYPPGRDRAHGQGDPPPDGTASSSTRTRRC